MMQRTVAIRSAEQAFSKISNGSPKSEADLAVLLLLAAHLNTAAITQLEKLGGAFIAMTFSEERRESILEAVAGEETERAMEVKKKISLLWSKVEASRLENEAKGVALRRKFDLPEGLEPDPHQLEAVLWFTDNDGRLLLADDMGLGKTIEALLCIGILGEEAWPVLIISPASVLYTWSRTATAWLQKLSPRVHVVDDAKTPIPMEGDRRIVVVSYDRFVNRQQEFFSFKPRLLICDESHLLTNWTSLRTRAMVRIRKDTKYRLLLSGTPMPNGRHRELYAQATIVDERIFKDLGEEPYKAYLNKYGGKKVFKIGKRTIVQFDGRDNEADLGRRMARVMLRRTKEQIGGLPEKTRYALSVPLTTKDRLFLANVEDQTRKKFQEKANKIRNELIAANKSDRAVEEGVKKALLPQMAVLTEDLRMAIGRIKAEWSVTRIRELVAEGHRVLIFTFHHDIAHHAGAIYKKAFGEDKVLVGTGVMDAKQRDELISKAEGDKKTGRAPVGDVLVLTGAFGTGVTLVSFDRGMLIERFWVPGQEKQIEDRIYRRGQDKDVAWDYPMVHGTLDDRIHELQTWKEKGELQIHGSAEIRCYEWLTGLKSAT
jgi:SWI/SNF-related matrix-associated actin-dependent regulator 1 of chromatin subfamily A